MVKTSFKQWLETNQEANTTFRNSFLQKLCCCKRWTPIVVLIYPIEILAIIWLGQCSTMIANLLCIPWAIFEAKGPFMPLPIPSDLSHAALESEGLASHLLQVLGQWLIVGPSQGMCTIYQTIERPYRPPKENLNCEMMPSLVFWHHCHQEPASTYRLRLPQWNIKPYPDHVCGSKFRVDSRGVSIDAKRQAVEWNINCPGLAEASMVLPVFLQVYRWNSQTRALKEEVSNGMGINKGPVLHLEFFNTIIHISVLDGDLDSFDCLGVLTRLTADEKTLASKAFLA